MPDDKTTVEAAEAAEFLDGAELAPPEPVAPPEPSADVFTEDDGFNNPQPSTNGKPDNGKQGCQCRKCKTEGNRDKRGRHHATCPCPICCDRRGEPVTASQGPQSLPASQAPQPEDNPFTPSPVQPVEQVANFGQMGALTFDMTTGALCSLFGPEWQAKTKEERDAVIAALAEYYKSKGMQDLPPGWMLLFVVAAYSAPRLAHNNTQSKLKLLGHWCKVKVTGFLAMFKRRKPVAVATERKAES